MRLAYLACDVFRDELASLGLPDSEVHWLPMGLHDQPAELRRALGEALTRMEGQSPPALIVLVFGRCGNGLVGLRAGRTPLLLPRAHDCIALLLGSDQRYHQWMRSCPGSYFFSPGWIRGARVPGPERERSLREHYATRHPDDPDLVADLVDADRETFAHHDTLAYLSLCPHAGEEAWCRQRASDLGWNFAQVVGDAAWLQRLVNADTQAPDLLLVPPGHQIAERAGSLVAIP